MTHLRNYQKSTLKIKCKGCNDPCELLYDRHHDQTFSTTCGTVIMESNNMLIDYPANPLFWEQQKTRREQIKQLQKIINKIKELEITYTTTEDPSIILPELTNKQEATLTNMCTDTDFKLILEKKYTQEHEYLGSQYIIKKDGAKDKSGTPKNINRRNQKTTKKETKKKEKT